MGVGVQAIISKVGGGDTPTKHYCVPLEIWKLLARALLSQGLKSFHSDFLWKLLDP